MTPPRRDSFAARPQTDHDMVVTHGRWWSPTASPNRLPTWATPEWRGSCGCVACLHTAEATGVAHTAFPRSGRDLRPVRASGRERPLRSRRRAGRGRTPARRHQRTSRRIRPIVGHRTVVARRSGNRRPKAWSCGSQRSRSRASGHEGLPSAPVIVHFTNLVGPIAGLRSAMISR